MKDESCVQGIYLRDAVTSTCVMASVAVEELEEGGRRGAATDAQSRKENTRSTSPTQARRAQEGSTGSSVTHWSVATPPSDDSEGSRRDSATTRRTRSTINGINRGHYDTITCTRRDRDDIATSGVARKCGRDEEVRLLVALAALHCDGDLWPPG